MIEFVADPAERQEARHEPQQLSLAVPAPATLRESERATLDQAEEAVASELVTALELPELAEIPKPQRRPSLKPIADHKKPARAAPEKPELQPAPVREEPVPEILDQSPTWQRVDRAALAFAAAGSVGRDVRAEERWQGRLAAHLERRKRYPSTAMSRHAEGVVYVRFLVEPDGSVTRTELARSSNVPELDQEVLALIERAAPLPPPPPGVNSFVTVPVSFSIRR
ncbi:MAG: TonB family protein [Pseudomonadota bacterium]